MGRDGWTGALLATPVPIKAGLVYDILPWPTAHLLAMAQGLQPIETRDRTARGLKIEMKAQPTVGTPALCSALDVRVGAIWLGNAPPQPKL